jgi:hypothetical protein
MTQQEIHDKVREYVLANYKSTFKPEDNIIVKEKENHFQVLKNPTSSPLILGKGIIE